MRIHTDTIEERDIYAAASLAGAQVEVASRHGSKKRDHAFEVHLSGNSRRRPNRDHDRDEYAATWDQWGVFLGKLFDIDPELTTTYYRTREIFDFATDDRFFAPDNFEHSLSHDHNFRYNGVPYSNECVGRNGCGAIRRWDY